MSEEIEEFKEQIETLLSEIDLSCKNELPKLNGNARTQKMDYLKGRLKRCKQVVRSYKVELRDIDPEAKPTYEKHLEEWEEKIARFAEDLSFHTASSEASLHLSENEYQSTHQLVALAKDIQQETVESSTRIINTVGETIRVGEATREKLVEQTDVMVQMQDNLEQVDSNLKRAQTQLRDITRKLGSDRIFMALVLLVVLGVIGAIVVHVIQPSFQSQTQPKAFS